MLQRTFNFDFGYVRRFNITLPHPPLLDIDTCFSGNKFPRFLRSLYLLFTNIKNRGCPRGLLYLRQCIPPHAETILGMFNVSRADRCRRSRAFSYGEKCLIFAQRLFAKRPPLLAHTDISNQSFLRSNP